MKKLLLILILLPFFGISQKACNVFGKVKFVEYGMGNVSVGDYQPIYDSEAVCKYVTKHIDKTVDYYIVFKS